MTNILSKCCRAKIKESHNCDDDLCRLGKKYNYKITTAWYECSYCKKPCDPLFDKEGPERVATKAFQDQANIMKKTKKLSNFEIIKRAWNMNYATQLKKRVYGIRWVVNIMEDDRILLSTGSMLVPWNLERFEIVGFYFCGELGGGGQIPEGQKFKVKGTGKVMEFLEITENGNVVRMKELGKKRLRHFYFKSEIEPYFGA
jgi:hypothetical protein